MMRGIRMLVSVLAFLALLHSCNLFLPPEPTESNRDDGGGCHLSTLHQRLIRKTLPSGNVIQQKTRCPDAGAWLLDYWNQISDDLDDTESYLAFFFGCNKGYDAINTARMVSRKASIFSKFKWKEALNISDHGACGQGRVDKNTEEEQMKKLLQLKEKSVEVHCVEAAPSTAERLRQASLQTKSADNGLIVKHYALTGDPLVQSINFPDATDSSEVGKELFNFEFCQLEKYRNSCTRVTAMTIDQYMEKHLDDKDRRIPFISIDVEGYDFTLMKAAKETLKRTDYLEFEYHHFGDWKNQTLEDAVAMLKKDYGFVCYWAGRNELWQITDCFLRDLYEFHDWSNVACVNPDYQPQLSKKMHEVFEKTLAK
jgi:FkbM family methyltransferase